MNRKFLQFIFLLFFGCLQAFADTLPERCTQECVESFGVKVGESFAGIPAYSNCQNSCVNPTPNFVAQVYTGIKWQCVEFARRWLLVKQGVVYGDVDIAADIWNLDYVYTPDKEKSFPFKGYLNGSSDMPKRGDLLIYASEFYGTGHVAVVLQIDTDQERILVGEQNYDNNKWRNRYARAIPYVDRDNGIWLLDPYIVGWKRVIY